MEVINVKNTVHVKITNYTLKNLNSGQRLSLSSCRNLNGGYFKDKCSHRGQPSTNIG